MIGILSRLMLSVNPALKISKSLLRDICDPSCINHSHTLYLLHFYQFCFMLIVLPFFILFLMLFCKEISHIIFVLYYPKEFLNEFMFMNEE